MLGQCARFAKSKPLFGNIFQECHDMINISMTGEDCWMYCGIFELCCDDMLRTVMYKICTGNKHEKREYSQNVRSPHTV